VRVVDPGRVVHVPRRAGIEHVEGERDAEREARSRRRAFAFAPIEVGRAAAVRGAPEAVGEACLAVRHDRGAEPTPERVRAENSVEIKWIDREAVIVARGPPTRRRCWPAHRNDARAEARPDRSNVRYAEDLPVEFEAEVEARIVAEAVLEWR